MTPPLASAADISGPLSAKILQLVQDLLPQGHPRKCATGVEAFTIVWQFAFGMLQAQKAIPSVSHGDLTPANLLYNGGPVLISDFGLTAIERSDRAVLRATAGYEAPEYASTGPTPAADVYSFGVIVSELAESCAGARSSLFRWGTRARPDGVIQALEDLAQLCRVPAPDDRPAFGTIVQKLGDSVRAFPHELEEMFVRSGELYVAFHDWRASLIPEIAKGLLKISAPQYALQMLDAVAEDAINGSILVLRGSSLSLLNRDEDALACFERALQAVLEPAERFNCLAEYALSLKRVARFEDAERIYRELLAVAEGRQLPQVVVNLASVYSESGKHQEAVDLLLRFIRENSHEPLVFAALAIAYEGLGQYEAAVAQYQRALSLAPDRADFQVALARIFLKDLGRWEDASEALFAAHQQGFMSLQWLVLSLAVSIVTGRHQDADMLLTVAKRDLPAEAHAQIEKQAIDMALAAMRQATGIPQPTTEAESVAAAADDPSVEGVQPREPAMAEPLTEQSSEPANSGFQPAGFPFFNVRFHLPENQFSFDFYEKLDRPDYADRLLENWNRFRRDPSVNMNAELRSTPLYFHRCPACGADILTNRDQGSNLNCRQCDTRNPTVRIENEQTILVLAAVHRALRKELKSYKGVIQYLVFQPVDSNAEVLGEMKETCRAAGFEELADARSPLRRLAIVSARRAGLPFDEQREIVVTSMLGISDELSYGGDTPLETDRLVRKLRRIASIRSFSTNLDISANDPATLMLSGQLDEMEHLSREAVARSPEELEQILLLVLALRLNKKAPEAKSVALRGTILAPGDAEAWAALADAERNLGEYEAAISHAETALAINPLKRKALVTLFLSQKSSGNEQRAEETRARIEALGGPELFD